MGRQTTTNEYGGKKKEKRKTQSILRIGKKGAAAAEKTGQVYLCYGRGTPGTSRRKRGGGSRDTNEKGR